MRRPKGRAGRGALLVLGAAAAYILFTLLALALTAGGVSSAALEAIQVAEAGVKSGRAGEADVASERLDTAASMFARVSRRLEGWWLKPGDLVPGVRHNQRALRAMAVAGRELSEQASQAAESAGGQDLSISEGAIDLEALAAMHRQTGILARAAATHRSALEEADSSLLLPPVSGRLGSTLALATRAATEAQDLSEAARLGAQLLGSDGPRRYFLALMTPSELRGAGGMIGNFGVLVADRGRIGIENFGRTRELNEGGTPKARTISGPEDYVARYGRFLPATTWQNVTMSPDFPSVAQVIEELYPQSGGTPVDGVIGLDPAALAGFLKLTGPVSVASWPTPINSDNAETALLYEQYLRFPTPDRVEFLAEVVDATFQKLTSSGIRLSEAGRALNPGTQGRHIQVHSRHDSEQALLRRLDLDGGLESVDGDYLAVVNQNASGSKVDRFLKRSLSYEVEFDPATSTVTSVAEVTLENRAPSAGLPDYLITPHPDAGADDLPPGTNRTYMSLYSPLEVESVTINGEPTVVSAERELSRNVYSLFYDLPSESVTVVRYQLRGPIDSKDYRLDVRSQVFGSEPEQLSFELRGATGWRGRAEGPLASKGGALEATQRLTKDFKVSVSFARR